MDPNVGTVTCSAANCTNARVPTYNFCVKHVCSITNCTKYGGVIVNGKPLCTEHCASMRGSTNQKCTYNGCMKDWYMNFRCYEHMQMPGPPKPTTPTETNKHFLCPCGKIPLMGYTFCKACVCKYDNCAKERVITTHYCRDHQTQCLHMECVDGEKCNHVEHLVEIVPMKCGHGAGCSQCAEDREIVGVSSKRDRSPCDICLNEMCLAHELIDKIQYDANVTQLFVKIFDHVRNCECRKGVK